MYTFYEFFAGGGMARLGLGESWRCLFANDFDPVKAQSYLSYYGDESHYKGGDIASLTARDLPGRADMAWASFPCQDLSLAGNGQGLGGKRTGAYWPFRGLLEALDEEHRKPSLVVLENVYGLVTSHKGADLANLFRSLHELGYLVGPLVMDARHFLPQSRPRLFVVAADAGLVLPESLIASGPTRTWHPDSLGMAFERLSAAERSDWLWWRLPKPLTGGGRLMDCIEAAPEGVGWHTPFETRRLLDMMSPINRAKVDAALAEGGRKVGCLYRRTRVEKGHKKQRAEVRFDDVAGCLRTPAGGSSRQTILVLEDGVIRSRLLSAREAARLMGLPDDYPLPARYNDAYKLAGDGVAVPVVGHLSKHLLAPLLAANAKQTAAA